MALTRATYRIMLYCNAFHMSDDQDEVLDLEENHHDEIVAQRVSMLRDYSTQELFGLNDVFVFLKALTDESTALEPPPTRHLRAPLGKLGLKLPRNGPLEEARPERDIPKLISEIYALKREEFKDWKKSDALCDACLLKIISAHIHLWLFKWGVKDGWEAPEGCWYSYDFDADYVRPITSTE
ncbi:hypothetical protein K438DRAFT_1962014 [Mycena galopus ATCC 62051]|nr:hypothetical protein K438DRAFT_1962014 [Mycena galopus ATCC 62051]